MGWCWRRCLSEEDGDGDGDDIGHYPLCWGCFFLLFFWEGLFCSRRSRDGGDNDEWETYMSTRNGIFSFSSYIYLLCSEQIFFSFSPTQESYTCKDSYLMLALLLLL